MQGYLHSYVRKCMFWRSSTVCLLWCALWCMLLRRKRQNHAWNRTIAARVKLSRVGSICTHWIQRILVRPSKLQTYFLYQNYDRPSVRSNKSSLELYCRFHRFANVPDNLEGSGHFWYNPCTDFAVSGASACSNTGVSKCCLTSHIMVCSDKFMN